MRVLAVHHVSINVTDVPAALDFYVNTLGCGQRTDRPDFRFGGAWLDLGAQQVHLIEAETPAGLGQHFAVQVEDLAEVVTELRAKGVTISDPKPAGSGLQCFTHDPSGNMVELHEVGGAVRSVQ